MGGSHCAACSQKRETRRGSSADRGYGKQHRKLRILCFTRDEWRCRKCGWEPAIIEEFRKCDMGMPESEVVLKELRKAFALGERHLHADHIVPIEQDENRRLDLENMQTLCDRCHRRKTQTEGALATR
jgi:5-methylcytosine-specific restriction endonuclease McrA